MAVVGDQYLTAQAVRAALSTRGFQAVAFTVPHDVSELRQLRQHVIRQNPMVAVLLHELLDRTHLTEAMRTLRDVPEVPWLLLSASQDEAQWGAGLAAGAEAVLSISIRLPDLLDALTTMMADRPVNPPETRARLITAWAERGAEHRALMAKLELLSPRESQVLEALRRGESVTQIAALSGVSVGTVRSQVRAVLRKLDVSSQLAAVAMLQRAHEEMPSARPR